MISLQHIYFAYERGPYLLKDLDMVIENGDYISVVGENGSGKSTLIKLILGLLSPSSGKAVNTFHHCAYVPQRFETLNSQFPITVYEVLNCYRKVLHIKDKKLIWECLEQMKVADLKDRLIGNLSGGQCQKVMIARALIGNPDLLIFDEPSTGIDVKSQMELYPFIRQLNQKKNITVVTVEHNLKFAIHNSTKMFHIVGGHGHFCSPADYIREYVSDTIGREADV
ncbi:metal ABC transporter ATP-binding protein [Megasphaera cerevisiae DSM 20462]|jgi:zinc transport system ATP-binding protein|uniref:Metal ABC transporter ATP-binding protein n=1 Tax=Megasphaera cerevisiae DSM 20462 TaxID=1122219 RepID=A0A0J6WUE7_9FIRM|nr:metal ABC transporter ATP-binding protein [Megasphaera cerevisiae]KMO85808.1 metal ABC transporter ATP-binding protein [Megasphaera cerevisiae DSM 20462]OKY52958.1 metal ABC transporter ATP-binding protein [Megasphaera cerevisiae]SJZ70764.1 zinc transport system ATP-binding protein [Megasphaera cerevisiae DSM 20462]